MSAETAPRPRDSSFDILKGLGILAVVTLHTTNYSARRFAESGSFEWWALTILNRIVNFGVPLFLMVSAILWTRSQARSGAPWSRFYRARLKSLVWPYVLWTTLLLLARYIIGHNAADHYLMSRGGLSGPAMFMDWSARARDYLLGKAEFHLYFMVILISFMIFYPLVFGAMRKVSASFGVGCLVAFLVEAAVILVQKVVRFPYPATLFTWHLMVLLPGVWIGLHYAEWPEAWRRARLPLLAWLIAFLCLFLWQQIALILKTPLVGWTIDPIQKLFMFFSAACLVGVSLRWKEASTHLGKLLRELGENSLPIYLIHPLFLKLMSGPRIGGAIAAAPASPLVLWLLLMVVSYGFAKACTFARLDPILFGKS